MSPDKKSAPSANKSISINGDVKDSAVIIGDNNTVNQTIIQKFFNIFKSDSESIEHRNRRILLGHVENAWIKGVLDASLHGAALLDLGIKQDPDAVTQYPWAIKKESTDETLHAGTSMLEIFDSIGMGRSLLILGAPGSGKTTMLLELARQLIARGREDVTYPIPMVFNLASWTEKLTLADWLAQELNNLYSVPRKTAPDWIKGDKLLLLLDGLDEVRQDSRAKCVEAINTFRKEYGLTSLAVCSRSQDYADLNAKLSFEGAIEVQPLTQKQITEFFNRFGKEMAGIKQVLKKDRVLREMAETPLFLSIMILAYQDKNSAEILISENVEIQRKNLFNTYIAHMFNRAERPKNEWFKKQEVLSNLTWLASKMIAHNQAPYLFERMQPYWLCQKQQVFGYRHITGLIIGFFYMLLGVLLGVPLGGLIFGLSFGLVLGLVFGFTFGQFGEPVPSPSVIKTIDSFSWNWKVTKDGTLIGLCNGLLVGLLVGLIVWISSDPYSGIFWGLFLGLVVGLVRGLSSMPSNIKMIDSLAWNWKTVKNGALIGLRRGVIFGVIFGLPWGLFFGLTGWWINSGLSKEPFVVLRLLVFGLLGGLLFGMLFALLFGLIGGFIGGISVLQEDKTTRPGQVLSLSVRNSIFIFLFIVLFIVLLFGLFGCLFGNLFGRLIDGLGFGLIFGLFGGLVFGGWLSLIQHYTLRFILARNNLLPWRLSPSSSTALT